MPSPLPATSQRPSGLKATLVTSSVYCLGPGFSLSVALQIEPVTGTL